MSPGKLPFFGALVLDFTRLPPIEPVVTPASIYSSYGYRLEKVV